MFWGVRIRTGNPSEFDALTHWEWIQHRYFMLFPPEPSCANTAHNIETVEGVGGYTGHSWIWFSYSLHETTWSNDKAIECWTSLGPVWETNRGTKKIYPRNSKTKWRLGSKTYSLLLLLLRIKMEMQTVIAHFIYYINKTININIIHLCTVN